MRVRSMLICGLLLGAAFLMQLESCSNRSNPGAPVSGQRRMTLRVSFTPTDYSSAANFDNPWDSLAALHNGVLQGTSKNLAFIL